MNVVIQYRGNKVELSYDAECTITRKGITFTNVLCRRNLKTGTTTPIDFEQSQIEKILDMYEIDPEPFYKLRSQKSIIVNINNRLNPTTIIHCNLPEKNKVISKLEDKKKSMKSQPKIVEYDPDYSPNDALNRRLKGSYW